jgi:peroxiredoxin family protein
LAERDRLSVVLLSGDFERVHYALCLASAAAALERPVTLFVTLGGRGWSRASSEPTSSCSRAASPRCSLAAVTPSCCKPLCGHQFFTISRYQVRLAPAGRLS